jgi:ribose-phosphate pyrophosphokinase
MPCYAYARQDKKDKPRACISARVFANQLEMFKKFERIACVELHNSCIQGYMNMPCDNFYTSDLMCQTLRETYNVDDLFIVSPDVGGIPRAAIVSDKLNRPFIFMRKKRDYSSENKVLETILVGDSNDIEQLQGKTAVIVDDMIDTAGTLIESVKVLASKGAKEVVVIVTHGILSGPALANINKESSLTAVIVSNSVPQTKNQAKCPKLKVYRLDRLLAAGIDALVNGKSVSELFEK